MTTNTIKLHGVLRAPPERVYRTFLDADATAKWLPPHGFTGNVHQLDDRVGGKYRMSFANFSSGQSLSFGTELDIVQEGIPGSIPPESCYLGWQESFTLLAQLIEAENPG